MVPMSRWLWLPLVAFLAAPVFAADKKDDPKQPTPKLPTPKLPQKKEAEHRVLTAGTIVGEVVHVEPGKQEIRVKVTVQYQEFNAGALQGLMQAKIQLAQARTPSAQLSALRNLAQQQRNLYTVKTSTREVAVEAGEKFEVRLAQPKAAFDDQGNIKKYTPRELASLRGRDRMYDGEFSDLNVGQLVQVTIIKPPRPVGRPLKADDIKVEDLVIKTSRIAVLRQPVAQP
jgi:hypothetical protein